MSALRPYEILIIVDPRPTDEEAAALLTQLGEQLKSLGAEVGKLESPPQYMAKQMIATLTPK